MQASASFDLSWLPSVSADEFALIRQPYPNIPNLAHLSLKPAVSRTTVEALLMDLPALQSLSFFDADFPSPSDPGAYFRVEREHEIQADTHCVRAGNHGWSTDWRRIEIESLVIYLWGCRHANMQRHQPITLGLAGDTSRTFDHDPQSIFAQHIEQRLSQIRLDT